MKNILHNGIAFLLSVVAFNPSRNLGIASLPVIPTAGSPAVAAAPTLAVGGAIKPDETPGSIIAKLNAQLDGSDPDVKFIVIGTVGSPLTRVIMMPTSVSDATALSGETLRGTIVPDEETGDTVPSTAADEGGDATAALADVLEFVNAESKPRRNVSSLVNGVIDKILDPEGSYALGALGSNFAIVVNQADEDVKIYGGATAGTLTGELADVSTEAAPPSAGTRSVLRGS